MQIRRVAEWTRNLAALALFAGALQVGAQFPPPAQPGAFPGAPGAAPGFGAPGQTGISVPAAPITGPIMADVQIGAGQTSPQPAGLFPGAPPPAQPQVGAGSSPHPTTYTWAGEKQDVTDPGPYFFHFYYTGTVQPDARVLPEDDVQRIPIRQNEWANYRRYIIAKLTNFFQITNGVQPTALADYHREMSGEAESTTIAPVATPPPQPVAPVGFQPAFPSNDPMAANAQQFAGSNSLGQFGQFGQFAAPTFDAKAAAEWTFYYDQLVLWQYYCTRTLLNEDTDELIDQPQQAPGVPGGGLPAPIPFAGGGSDLGDDIEGGGAAAFAPVAIAAAPQQVVVREVFDALEEYQEPNTNVKYRDKFIDRAQEHEETVYQAYIDMINRIDEEALNQEKYDQWIAQRQTQIVEFADNWRRLREGETLILDNTLFLITPEKLEAPPVDAINLQKNAKLTPQDLLNQDGTVKKAEVR